MWFGVTNTCYCRIFQKSAWPISSKHAHHRYPSSWAVMSYYCWISAKNIFLIQKITICKLFKLYHWYLCTRADARQKYIRLSDWTEIPKLYSSFSSVIKVTSAIMEEMTPMESKNSLGKVQYLKDNTWKNYNKVLACKACNSTTVLLSLVYRILVIVNHILCNLYKKLVGFKEKKHRFR